MKQLIALLGDGAWGTSIATLLAYRGHPVKLWCYNADLVNQINNNHVNTKYLPGVPLSGSIIACATIKEAVQDAQWIVEAIPVKYIRSVITQEKKLFHRDQKWITLSKGIEQNTLMIVSQIIKDIIDKDTSVAAISGPSFAADVAAQQLTAVIAAADNDMLASQLCDLLSCNYFKAYPSTDVIGVQLCGALKNVITLAVTMLEGAGYSDTTRAFILTKGLQEMQELVVVMGGESQTVYGLAGVGDLVLTASSNQSKNAQVGKKLGKGERLQMILKQTGYIPEGINTVQAVVQLADRYNLALPLCRGLHAVIFENKTVDQFLKDVTK